MDSFGLLVREAIHTAFAIGVLAVTGLFGYLWGRRRARDRDLFLLWRAAFDRPVFRGEYQYHSNPEKFRRSISTTMKTVATGIMFDSSGHELNRVKGVYYGPSQIRNSAGRNAVTEVQGRLQKIIRLSRAQQTAEALDDERDAVIVRLNAVWKSLGIAEMPLPTTYKEPEDIQAVLRDLEEEP